MSETSTTETNTNASANPFADRLAVTGQPDLVLEMISGPLGQLRSMILRHNSSVLRIQETQKQTDPNNVEILDAKWNEAIDTGAAPAEIVTAEAEYQAVTEKMMQLREKLREFGRSLIKPPLSSEELDKEKKAANARAKVIEDETTKAKVLIGMGNKLLLAANAEFDLTSLLPDVKSMRGIGTGRKSSSGGGGAYRTRLDWVKVNGKMAFREKTKNGVKFTESNFIHAAHALNAEWNSAAIPANTVTDEELEHAMYDAFNVSFRDSGSLPEELEFDFKKNVARKNPNDGKLVEAPETVHFTVKRNVQTSKSASAEETASDETATTNDADAEKVNTEAATEDVAEIPSETPAETVKENSAPVNAKAAALAAKKAAAQSKK